MSSSTSSRLPAVGTTFSSLLDFKIAAFTVAKDGLFSMRVFNSVSNRSAKLTCMGLGSRSFLLRNGFEPCTCHVRAYRDGKGGFEVKEVDDRHTCSLAQPGSKEARWAQSDMESRIDHLAKTVNHQGNTSGEEGEEEDEEESDADSNSSGSVASSQSAFSPPGTPERGGRTYKTDAACRQKQAERRRGIPTKRSLVNEVANLSKRVRLSLPASNQLFPDIRSLLSHLYAWGQQNNICLNQIPSSSSRILIVCKPDWSLSRCSFEVEVVKSDDGEWTASVLNSEHDKAIHAKAVERGMNRPVPKDQSVPSSLSPSSSKKRLQTAPAPSSSSPTLTHSPNKHASLPAHFGLALFNSQFDNTLSFDRLTSFFASLSPSTSTADASLASAALLNSGVSSISELSALVQFEVGTLLAFVEEIKEREGWSVEKATSLVRLLDAAKNAFEE